MKKVMLMAVLVSSFIFTMVARAESYDSVLILPGMQTLTGQERHYSQKNQRIEITPTRLGYLEGEIGSSTINPGAVNQLEVTVQKKGLLFFDSKASSMLYLDTLYRVYPATFSNVGSGTIRYVFCTGRGGANWGTIEANPVKMLSYN